MKKYIKIIITIITLFILISSLKVEAVNNEITNKNEKEDIYESKSFNIAGLGILFQDKEYFNAENNNITAEEKKDNNIIIGAICGNLVIYWLILLFIFEKEDTYDYTYEKTDDMEILKRYNPMLAGCLVDNRQVLARDVTAVVLNLIQKQALNMEMIPNVEGKDTYTYIISENRESTAKLDEIEKYVLNWLFGFYEQKEVDLIKKLKEISKRKDFLKHLQQLNRMTQSKLNNMGANINKVPLFVRIANMFLVLFSVIMATIHIANNGLNIHIYESTIFFIILVAIGIIFILPVVALIIHMILFLIVLIKRFIKSQAEKYSGKQIVDTSALILISMFIFILLVYIIVPNKYICLDIFMIGMSILIVKTDNLMTKHNKEILNDYYALQEIKYRISEYSLIKDEQINYMKLWEEYLVYAVAFGIPIQIVNKLKDTYQEDEDIEYLMKCENLYYICKAYLEVMWDMEFKEQKNSFNLAELFNTSTKNNNE